MKKLALLFLIPFFTSTVYGQYKQIANSDSILWYLKHEIWDGLKWDSLVLTDTMTINNKKYHKVKLNRDTIGYFREDTSSGKAWFWNIYDTSEYLIMDLSLKIHDTFLVKMVSDSFVTVSSIDTINGRKEIILNYHYGGGYISENLKFIEGVGPNASLFYQVNFNHIFSLKYRLELGCLVCKMYHDNSIVYAWDTVYFGCGKVTGIQENINNKELIILFPNPTNSTVQITIKDNTLLGNWLIIYNVFGQEIIQKQIDKADIIINLDNYPGHTFIYKIFGQKNTITGKIIKE